MAYPVLAAVQRKLRQAVTVDKIAMRSLGRMLPLALLLSAIAAPLPAAAQTAATPGSVIRNGVVTLGLLPTSASQVITAASTAAAASPTAGAVGPSGARATNAATASGGSSGSGAAAPAASGVPAWLMCPPSGASGIAPFLTGTDLSCAP